MKRHDLLDHILGQGCVLHREGAKHSVFLNPENGRIATVSRHRDIEIFLARRICRQLDIAIPKIRA